jgi:uncharacterized membrane-anchored protein YitT (DUF2179 family)
MLYKPFMLALILMLLCATAFAQNTKHHRTFRLSKEDMRDLLLERADKEKTKGIIALISGPVLTGVGVYIISKHASDSRGALPGAFNGSGTYAGSIGTAIGVTGVLTTLLSIPLFMSASNAKKEARLIFTEQSTGCTFRKIAIRAVGLQLAL